MLLLCIDTSNIATDYKKYTSFKIVENDTYEPMAEKTTADVEYWLIYNGPKCQLWFKKSRFIPLSQIDEMDRSQQYQANH